MEQTEWDDHGVVWRSGPWALEVRGDEVADLTHGGRRVLRSIRAVVRDRDWNTASWITGQPVAGERMLRIPLRSTGYGSDLRGEVVVAATPDGLSVTFDAVSHGAFATNRTGLVVLHPPQTSGAALRVRHPDGTRSSTTFPVALSAHQPVFDIAGLRWSDDGSEISVDFSGDVFEMEDQRNWTDASFKTYSRPLSLPFPYDLAAGERVRQRIDVEVRPVDDGAAPEPAADARSTPASASVARTDSTAGSGAESDHRHGSRSDSDFASGPAPDAGAATARIRLEPAGPFPAVGVSASTAPDPEPPDLPTVGAELLVELDLDTPNWPAALRRAADRGLPLDVRVVLGEPDRAKLDALAQALRGVRVARVAVFHPYFHVSVTEWVAPLRDALDAAGVTAPVVGGSRSHFTELNRERDRMPGDLAGLVTTVTPLFHAHSSAQLRESVAMQRLVARQTVDSAAGLPVRIGPIALRPRFNDVATGPQPGPTRSDLAEGYGAQFTGGVDPRQGTPELAAWTIASAAALAIPGVAALTYFEEWGPRGIRSADGAPLPVAAALEALAPLAGAELLAGDSPDGLLWALGARTAGGTVLLAANLDRVERTLELTVPSTDAAWRTTHVDVPPLGWARLGGNISGRGVSRIR
ncbi:hypothetical protein [Herbiconiux ginsengi]|uniref:Uncharacterized protein n=1 Tax=Herbiconiux ginsengi TaxID=381665 RepID=A0A1H3MLS4_9MICO|nr:hypothetical protein [Herbiconiux ginsengi]SDY77556.1 hypothetical protein SAMN05216554_1477 [Herbiconiux ginsengi]